MNVISKLLLQSIFANLLLINFQRHISLKKETITTTALSLLVQPSSFVLYLLWLRNIITESMLFILYHMAQMLALGFGC